ncbi:hypothetical protein [Fuscovulum blasticum]|uniref:hypothetical protein n=1 Tax=Fuscovulum blasticum TaxID=1075 RepID=UPI000D3E09DE|nr:hypothetical protein [Fuscovulum blasticum]AWD21985.1 hypothetical protein B6K69_10110 [Fuscovulum blasticum]
MIRTVLIALLLSASPAMAEVARVKGGEHPDFTRIVIEAAAAGDWRFGRTEDGYELALGPDVTGFDLSQAFQKIPRNRVSGLWRDPASGRLRLALSCACHAIAFEFRPGVIVVDIKTGAPPADTAFENPIDPPAPALAPPDAPAGSAGYDWLAIRPGGAADTPPSPARPAQGPLVKAATAAALDPLRRALLEQLSRGVAQGVVEIARPARLPEGTGPRGAGPEGIRIALGELPGLRAATIRDPDLPLSALGLVCPDDTALSVADWGLTGPPAEQLGAARSGLLGEFDTPVPEAVLRATRAHVALGFGAEGRQILNLLDGPDDPDRARLRALTFLVDLEPAMPNPFKGLESCDTAAALWAALALAVGRPPAASEIRTLNTAAVARSFSALPAHLRHHLGPPLVALFLTVNDDETARRIKDAALRAPGPAAPEVALMDAGYQLATGDQVRAGALADSVLKESGPGQDMAAVTRVEAAFQGDHSLPPDLPAVLAAFRQEARGTAREGALTRALILASAMTGDFETSFALLPKAPQTGGDLWQLAADGAGDGVFLAQAVAAAGQPPKVADTVAQAVATRLTELGFPAEALAWLGPLGPAAPDPVRLLAARARLQLRDARGALEALSGLSDAEAESLRAAAVLQLGDAEAAAAALGRAGDAAGRDRALVRAEDWPQVAQAGPEAWKAAAALVGPAPAGAAASGPIARGAALADETARARATLKALLETTVVP